MQAKDIPDEDFLAAVKTITDRKGMWANRSEVAEELQGVPEKASSLKPNVSLSEAAWRAVGAAVEVTGRLLTPRRTTDACC